MNLQVGFRDEGFHCLKETDTVFLFFGEELNTFWEGSSASSRLQDQLLPAYIRVHGVQQGV